MKILDRQHQFNRYCPLVELDDGSGIRLQFLDEVSDSEVLTKAQEITNRMIAEQEYNAIETVTLDILDHVEVLKYFVRKIKATPNVTLAQYNTWLATKTWYEAAIIRYFVFVLATKLILTLANLSETEVLRRLRDWIVASDLKTIGKKVGYGSPND